MLNRFKWVLITGLLGWTYYPTFLWMIERWSARDSYYGHGFLIPLVSLFWIYKKREALAKVEGNSDPAGLVILGLGALLQLASSFLRIYFVSAFSLIIVLFGAVYYMHGRKVLKEIWYPICFLVLMVPLPLLVISEITLRMKFFVSEISTFLVNQSGIKAVREGSYIYTPNAMCVVGDPCSGLRSFLAFLCLGLVFAYGENLQLWKKLILIVAGLPLAIVSNVIRVYAMTLVGEIYGMEMASNKIVHDGAGIFVFFFALVCFMFIRSQLEGNHVKQI